MADSKVPFARSRDIIDAENLPFTPATLANWTGSADPGSTKAALDQLAARIVSGISTAPFQVPTVADAAALAALTASEGDIAWQADTNVLYVYTGSAWTAVITAVALGTAPFQVPTVADAAALAALTASEGDIAWQADTNVFYVYTGAAWTSVVTAAELATAPFQVPVVADNAAKAALTASEGDLVWQADTNVLYVYTGVTWLAVLQSTDITSLQTSQNLQRIINISAGAEAANAIPLTFTVTKGDGSAITLPARLKLSIYSDDVLDAIVAAAAFSLTDGGAGSLLSSAAVNAVYIFETDLSGSLVVDVNDVGGASGLTRYIKVELIHTGVPADTWAATMIRQAVTFDGV